MAVSPRVMKAQSRPCRNSPSTASRAGLTPVQLAGLVFILVPYLVLKLGFDAGNGPLVSFLHRLVLNPTLLLLLIPAFYYLVDD